ncbi:unnamed protein product, partial [Rotaria socialis]
VKDPLPVEQMASESKQFREQYHAISSNTTAKTDCMKLCNFHINTKPNCV